MDAVLHGEPQVLHHDVLVGEVDDHVHVRGLGPLVIRTDGGDQLHVVTVRHGGHDLGTHPTVSAEHTHFGQRAAHHSFTSPRHAVTSPCARRCAARARVVAVTT